MSARQRPIVLTESTVLRDAEGGEWRPFAYRRERGVLHGPEICALCGAAIREGYVQHVSLADSIISGDYPAQYVCAKHVEIVIPARTSQIVRPK